MQPGPNSEDINTILSRFHTWAEKQPANGNGNGHKNGNGSGEPREISYEEAILQHRGRRPAQTPRCAAPPAKNAAAAVPPPPVDATQPETESTPAWIANLPVVPDTQSVELLRIVAAAPLPALPENTQIQPAQALEERSNVPESPNGPFPARRAATARKVKVEAPKQTPIAAAPAIPPTINEPPTVIAAPPAARPVHKEASKSPRRKIAAPAPILAARKPMVTAAIAARPPATRPGTAAKPRSAAPTKIAAKSSAQNAAAARKAAASKVATARTCKPKRPPFRRVLANSIQPSKTTPASEKKSAPDRTRRITTRFSPAEERRIEKQAADLGINVSAYLRQCALAASAAQNALAPAVANAAGNKKARKPESQAPAESRLYYAPSGSFLGGWLALLRNRFLGPPARFSEEV